MTAEHIFKLVTLGAYIGNHIFRVDKGFVAQVADVVGNRDIPMNEAQQVRTRHSSQQYADKGAWWAVPLFAVLISHVVSADAISLPNSYG